MSPTYSLKFKNIILILSRGLYIYIFSQMVIFATLFRCCLTLWKSTLKIKTFQRFNVAVRCNFQRSQAQRCSNVDSTLSNVATSYQPKNNVKPTLKCLRGSAIVLANLFKNYLVQTNHGFFLNCTKISLIVLCWMSQQSTLSRY